MRREFVAIAIGVSCLLIAAAVGAKGNAKPTSTNSIAGQIDQAKVMIEKMHKMVKSGFAELQEARTASNVGRVNCVNDALTAMKGLLRLAEGNFLSMQEAASRKATKDVEHEFIKVTIAYNKTDELNGQLKGCGGPSTDGAIDGRPYIEKNIETDTPNVDPTEGLKDLAPALENTVSASPFFQ